LFPYPAQELVNQFRMAAQQVLGMGRRFVSMLQFEARGTQLIADLSGGLYGRFQHGESAEKQMPVKYWQFIAT